MNHIIHIPLGLMLCLLVGSALVSAALVLFVDELRDRSRRKEQKPGGAKVLLCPDLCPSESDTPEPKAEEIQTICAWCSPKSDPQSGERLVSHGICKDCAEIVLQQANDLKTQS